MSYNLAHYLSSAITAYHNCKKTNNHEWITKHRQRIEELAKTCLPSGSGFDSGCTVDYEMSSQDRIVIETSFHHMNEDGYYDGWSNHHIIVTPGFMGPNYEINSDYSNVGTGAFTDDFDDYVIESLDSCLTWID